MISYTSLQFYWNAALEIAAIIFLAVIFASVLIKKKARRTRFPFALFIADLIFLLSCNMITWVLDGMFVSPSHLPRLYTLDLVLTVFDFFFYCFGSVLFYVYILSLIGRFDGEKKKKAVFLAHMLGLYTLVITLLFASSMYTGWFYSFPDDGYTHYTAAYWVLLFSVPAVWLSLYTVIKNRSYFGRAKTALLLAYIIIPTLLLVVDQIFSLSASYLCVAFIALIIYVGVDIEQEHALLEQEAQISMHDAEKLNMKVSLMMSQIQPHFLYNTLSSIAYLCRHDPKEAEVAVNEFSDYLAGNLRSINTMHPICFETELQHVENYLKIQKRRFPHRLNVEYDIQTTDFMIPSLTLQPIVENAVRHAVEVRLEMTTVRICSYETPEQFVVSVRDDGPGFDTDRKAEDERPHIGIASVRSRLDNMVGGKLEISSEAGAGATVTIIIPKVKKG